MPVWFSTQRLTAEAREQAKRRLRGQLGGLAGRWLGEHGREP